MAEVAMEDRVAAAMGLPAEMDSEQPVQRQERTAPEPKAAPQTPPNAPQADPEDDLDLGDLEAAEEAPKPANPFEAIELEIGGEKRTFTKDELKSLAEDGRTYKETAEALKTQRAAMEEATKAARAAAQLAPMVERGRAEGTMLLAVMGRLDQEIQSLIGTDPIQAQQKREEYFRLSQRFEQLRAADQQASQQLQALQHHQHQQMLAAEAPKLLEKIPSWKDSAKRDSDMKFIRSYMETEGYTPEHVAMVTDSRYVATLLKAAKYDALRAKQASKKVADAPPMARPGAAQAPGATVAQAKTDYRKQVNSANAKGDFHKAARLAESEFLRRLK